MQNFAKGTGNKRNRNFGGTEKTEPLLNRFKRRAFRSYSIAWLAILLRKRAPKSGTHVWADETDKRQIGSKDIIFREIIKTGAKLNLRAYMREAPAAATGTHRDTCTI